MRVVVEAAPPTEDAPRDEDERALARYQIGEVAERTGVTQRTLRFYEEKGLLRPSDRMEGGFRLYSENDVDRIVQIKGMQTLLGLTLAEIKEMVEAEELRAQIRATFRPDRELPARKARSEKIIAATQRQLSIVEAKLHALEAMQRELSERLQTVEARRQQIIEAMETGEPLPDN
jgi:DNA-binding transcriptional MerR regulator